MSGVHVGSNISIYSPGESIVSVDELCMQMAAMGKPIDWNYTLGSESGRPTGWTMGTITPAGRKVPRLSVHQASVTDELREEIEEDYPEGMPDGLREALSSGKIKYKLSAAEWSEPEIEALLVGVAYVFAGGGGRIHETETDRWYSTDEFRARFVELIGAPN